MFTTLQPLVLASTSPRRQAYFADLGLDFTVCAADIDEQARDGEEPASFVLRLAGEKAVAVRHLYPLSWVVAADTVVCVDGRLLGKPKDTDEAVEMLMALSGREHHVLTGFCVTCENDDVQVQRAVDSTVRFAAFGPEVARAYAETGEPLDKAGAYGIQGKGAFLVERISGSYSNIVGMPLHEVLEVLLDLRVVVAGRRRG